MRNVSPFDLLFLSLLLESDDGKNGGGNDGSGINNNNGVCGDVDVIVIHMVVMVTSDCVTHLSPSSTFHFPCQPTNQ